MTSDKSLSAQAREFVGRTVSYSFTKTEEEVLKSFFSNVHSHIFFMFGLPSNVGAALLARYSRMKNPRGLRGIFVDEFLPYLLASQVSMVQSMTDEKDPEGWYLKKFAVKTLDDFLAISSEARDVFTQFLRNVATDVEYLRLLVEAKRTKRTLGVFMDSYGHNSIARMGVVWLCCEKISMLAAKSIEWARPGAGYIELSGRFVELSKPEMYPAWRHYGVSGVDESSVKAQMKGCFAEYDRMYAGGEGPLPIFYREKYASRLASGEMSASDFKRGVDGECFDVLSNLLPLATLTSVAVAASGEAFPSILKHLALDGTPENYAIIERVLDEAPRIGADQFARHWEPTEAERTGWGYLDTSAFLDLSLASMPVRLEFCPGGAEHLVALFRAKIGFGSCKSLTDVARILYPDGRRAQHDKIPREFEHVPASFAGVISMRGWRDMQRMGFATHRRTHLTTKLGFFQYDKPAPPSLGALFAHVAAQARRLEQRLAAKRVSSEIAQYALPMGFNIGYTFGANLRQHEFCGWQRSKHDVNDEVRSRFLAHDRLLAKIYPWWHLFSRAFQSEQGKRYLFARSEGNDKRGVLMRE